MEYDGIHGLSPTEHHERTPVAHPLSLGWTGLRAGVGGRSGDGGQPGRQAILPLRELSYTLINGTLHVRPSGS